MRILIFILLLVLAANSLGQSRPRDLGIEIGVMKPGKFNAITDVDGVHVGHSTIIKGTAIRTGVTVVIPHQGNIFQRKVPAGFYAGNGFGKITGTTQIIELGNIETPIALTNTLSVPDVSKALINYTLKQPGNENVRSVNPVVGETNDGSLNDIRRMEVSNQHLIEAISSAKSGTVEEGNVGAGTGTICFGYKGGIGTASRVLPTSLGGYTVGVLVQSNFGGNLTIAGKPVGKVLKDYPFQKQLEESDGSCMIIVATDAPLGSRNLERLAKRAILGLARTGGIASNGSGDYVLAFSNNERNLIDYASENRTQTFEEVRNDHMSSLFMACIEATEEAIINSLFAAKSMTGFNNRTVQSLPLDQVLLLFKED